MKHTFVSLTCSLVTCLMLSAYQKSEQLAPVQPESTKNALCAPKIMSYHFGVEHLPVPRQVRVLDSLKMDGMMLQIETATLPLLDSYYQTNEVISNRFHIYSVFTSIALDNPSVRAGQLATIDAIYRKIQHRETLLQVLFYGDRNNANASAVIATLADMAKTYNKDVIIYPHQGLAIETAEQALAYIKASSKTNVYLALHLCHELAAGNADRIEKVVSDVGPYIKAVSISGATVSEKTNSSLPGWFWAIKPLYMGTYDLNPYYRALYRSGYEGPIAIHTYGIYDNFRLVPKVHLPQSRNFLLNLGTTACN